MTRNRREALIVTALLGGDSGRHFRPGARSRAAAAQPAASSRQALARARSGGPPPWLTRQRFRGAPRPGPGTPILAFPLTGELSGGGRESNPPATRSAVHRF
jgi:hypothetical protein